jgi:thioredoxin reductase (NADPH)
MLGKRKKEKKGKKPRKPKEPQDEHDPEFSSDDWFIPEDVRNSITDIFKDLENEVIIEVFIKDEENEPYNVFSTLFSRDLARLSDKIKVNMNTIGDEKSKKYKVEFSPTIMINPEEYYIRYTGAPIGEEGRSFLAAIMMVSKNETGLSVQSKKALEEFSEERHIQVFVTPGCPYCPDQVLHAIRAAVERPDIIKAECVESSENIELAKKYNVGAVPHTVINEKTVRKGLVPEEIFIEELITMEPSKRIREPGEEEGESYEVDLIIIGGGPAGLTAGIYAERSGLTSVILEKDVIGGQVVLTPVVENYPGFTNVGGKQLMDMISSHAKNYTNIEEGVEVLEIKVGKKIEAVTTKDTILGNALIIATGAAHRKLGVPGEEKYGGIGVSYCATCDGYLFKDKEVIVVGGGNSALTDALFLKTLGAKVTIIHRRDSFRAEKYLRDSIERDDIPVIWNKVVEEITGEGNTITGVQLKDTVTNKTETLKLNGVFVAVGEIPNSKIASDIGIELADGGYIKIDTTCRTNIPRIYGAGDITGGVRQIVTAVSEGTVAALSAFEDLKNPYWRKERK